MNADKHVVMPVVSHAILLLHFVQPAATLSLYRCSLFCLNSAFCQVMDCRSILDNLLQFIVPNYGIIYLNHVADCMHGFVPCCACQCDSQGYAADWTALCMGLVTLAYAVKLHVTEYGVLNLVALAVQQANVHSQHRGGNRGATRNQTPIVCYS